jgi:hypothetical protein
VGDVIHLTQQDFSERDFLIECPHCGEQLAEATSFESAKTAARVICEEEAIKSLAVRARHSGRTEVVVIR